MSTFTVQKDGAYYWPENVTFRVEDVLFRLPRFQFITGSDHFARKYGLCDDSKNSKEVVRLKGVTAADFRVFLEFLFPLPSNTPLASLFSKEEWLTILTLCTKWHFPEFRALAIQNLDGKLTELELIHVGRALHIWRFVVDGYRAIVLRPKDEIITDDEAATIGYETASKLWIVRYQLHVSKEIKDEDAVNLELYSRFEGELGKLDDLGRGDPQGDNADQKKAAEYDEEVVAACDGLEDGDVPTCPADKFQGAATEPSGQLNEQEPTAAERVDQEETERTQLQRTLEMLNEEEREIKEQLKLVRSRKLTPEAAENLEAVKKEMEERIERELRSIGDAKIAEEEAKRRLAEFDAEARRESPHQALDETSPARRELLLQLDDLGKRRAELEQEHANNKGKETGQLIRWRKVGKRHNQKALEKWNAELLRCQGQRDETEEQLLRLIGLEKRQDSDSAVRGGDRTDIDESGEAASTQYETAATPCDEVEQMAIAEGDQQSECNDELARVRQQKQAHLQREAKLMAQKANHSRKLENVEQLMRQGGVLLPETIEKRKAKQEKCKSKLLAIETELEEVRQLLEMTRAEEERIEEEIRWS